MGQAVDNAGRHSAVMLLWCAVCRASANTLGGADTHAVRVAQVSSVRASARLMLYVLFVCC
jgi:hypothetical protein